MKQHQGKDRTYSQLRWALAVIIMVGSQSSWATGFQLPVQNVTNLGTAYAGSASLATDASINYYNAAGLTRLNEEQVVGGATLDLLHTKLTVTRATATDGTVLSTTGKVRPANSALIPFFHYAKRINEQWMFGLSGIPIFGSKATYSTKSVARYMATRSSLKTFDFSPSLAYSFCNGLSLAAGVDAIYAAAVLNSQIGRGNIALDGFAHTHLARWGVGYHLGALYEWDDCTRVGLSYRSRSKIRLKGDSDLEFFAGAPLSQQSIKADLKIPDVVFLSVYHAFNEHWAIMSDFRWTHWKLFERIALRFQDGSQLITPADYKNSYMISLGGIYQCNEEWQFKAGAAFDKTPTRDWTRAIYLPDQNQTILGLGTKYQFSQCLGVDIGYAHIIYKKANINQPAPTAIGTTQGFQNIQGSARTQMDVIGLQFTWDLV